MALNQLNRSQTFKVYDYLKTNSMDGLSINKILGTLQEELKLNISEPQLKRLCKDADIQIKFKKKRYTRRSAPIRGEDRVVVLSQAIIEITEFLEKELGIDFDEYIKTLVKQVRSRSSVSLLNKNESCHDVER